MKLLLIVFISILSWNVSAQSDSTLYSNQRDSLVAFAKQQLGTPYLWGGTSSNGFDCSGFVYYVFKHIGISVPRTSRGFKGKGASVVLENAAPGDIILFTGTNSRVREIGHVGIVLKNNNGIIDFIHSSSSKKHFGVTITRYTDSGYGKRFLRALNILT